MRRLLVLALLSCSFTVSAQTDDRRIRTVDLDDGPPRAAQPDEPRAGADQPDENLQLARKLVELGADGPGAPEDADPCVPEADAMREEIVAAYRANPADFHGMSPRSAYWPEVERIWHAYYVDRCAAQGDEGAAAVIARSYAASLSTAQLRELVEFQESPTGRAFIAASAKARQDVEAAPAARAPADTDEASATFRQAMLRLKAKYERARR